MLAFGAEDSFNSHACGGKHVAVAFLLAFTARVCQVTAIASDSNNLARRLQAQPAAPSLQSDSKHGQLPLTSSGGCCTAELPCPAVCWPSQHMCAPGVVCCAAGWLHSACGCTAGISQVTAAAPQVPLAPLARLLCHP